MILSRKSLETDSFAIPSISEWHVPSSSAQPPSDGWEAENIKHSGLSNEVGKTLMAARRPAAFSVRIWRIYKVWCTTKEVPTVSLSSVLKFLQEGLNKGLSYNTLKVPFTALNALPESRFSNLVRRFFKAIRNLDWSCIILYHLGTYHSLKP